MLKAKPEDKWDYVFLYNSTPTPRMLDKVRMAIAGGRKVVLVYSRRSHRVLKMEDIQGCDILPRDVSYLSVDLRRFLSVFTTMFWLRRRIFRRVSGGCQVFTDSLDLLAVAQISSWGKRCVFRHYVRDLHSLQMEGGLISKILTFVERRLLRSVHMLVLTCEEYYKTYYSLIYRGEYVVIENYPARSAWAGFKREPSSEFIVGYVGSVRYMQCLRALVDAISILWERGLKIRLKVAGSGQVEELKAYCNGKPWVEMLGAFSYEDKIKEIYEDVDLNFSVYNTDFKNVRYAMPNKFYESVIAGIPILVAQGTYLEKRVLELGIGTSVPYQDSDAMAEVLETAYSRKDWYQEALRNLGQLDSSGYFVDAHRDSLVMAILG